MGASSWVQIVFWDVFQRNCCSELLLSVKHEDADGVHVGEISALVEMQPFSERAIRHDAWCIKPKHCAHSFHEGVIVDRFGEGVTTSTLFSGTARNTTAKHTSIRLMTLASASKTGTSSARGSSASGCNVPVVVVTAATLSGSRLGCTPGCDGGLAPDSPERCRRCSCGSVCWRWSLGCWPSGGSCCRRARLSRMPTACWE